ncbi:MAG: hypothetical protein IPI74_05890 [Bacteroidales bacterium]|nr:hypothetical protein [Bacteroidales bacterium]
MPCEAFSSAATITVDPAPVPGDVTGGTNVCTGTNSTLLTLSGYTGSVIRWQYSTDSGSTWNDIDNTSDTYTATDLTDTTQFRAVVQSGVCPEAFHPLQPLPLTLSLYPAMSPRNKCLYRNQQHPPDPVRTYRICHQVAVLNR